MADKTGFQGDRLKITMGAKGSQRDSLSYSNYV